MLFINEKTYLFVWILIDIYYEIMVEILRKDTGKLYNISLYKNLEKRCWLSCCCYQESRRFISFCNWFLMINQSLFFLNWSTNWNTTEHHEICFLLSRSFFFVSDTNRYAIRRRDLDLIKSLGDFKSIYWMRQ